MTGEPQRELRPVRGDLNDLRIDRATAPAAGQNRGWIWVLASIFFCAIAGLAFLYFWNSSWGIPSVRVGDAIRIAPAQGQTVLTASGYVVSRQKSTIGAKVSGRLQKLLVDEGDIVRQGELVAEIDSRDYAAKLQEAQANLADARRELERQKKLLAGGAGTQQAVDEQTTRLEVFQAQAEIARVHLEDTKIYAPFDGVVLQKMSEIGEMVSPGVVSGAVSSGAILSLGSAELEIEADVNESNFTKVFPGQDAEIAVDALPGRSFQGKVRLIEPKADRQKAVVQARVSILDPIAELRPEMGGKVSFRSPGVSSSPQESGVRIPSEALVDRDGGKAVYLLREGRAEIQFVEVVRVEDRFATVRSGLQGGERVLLSPPSGLKSGSRVSAGP